MTKPDQGDLSGYQVVVAVCGSIAVYKVCFVVSSLVQRGAGVTVAMTAAATRFVGPVTFQTLSGQGVLTDMWADTNRSDPQHLGLIREADLLLIAPATANMIGKMAGGICDDLISTMVTAARCPVLLAPAMNESMWQHPPLQANLLKLREANYVFVGPGTGWQACRSVGPGRLAEPDEIVAAVAQRLLSSSPQNGRTTN